MADVTISIEFLARFEALEKSIDEMKRKTGPGMWSGMITGINQAFEMAKKAWGQMSEFVNAAIDARKAEMQLEAAISNNTTAVQRGGETVRSLRKDWSDYANERQRTLGIDDESTKAVMKMLVTAGVAVDKVKDLTALAQDIAASTGQGSEEIAKTLALVYQAPEEAIRRLRAMGVQYDADQLKLLSTEQQRAKILGDLAQKFAGQAEAMSDASAGVDKFARAWEEFKETVGALLIGVLEPMLKVVGSLMGLFSGSTIVDTVKSIADPMTKAKKGLEDARNETRALAEEFKALQEEGADPEELKKVSDEYKKSAAEMVRLETTVTGSASTSLALIGKISTDTNGAIQYTTEQASAAAAGLATQFGSLLELIGQVEGTKLMASRSITAGISSAQAKADAAAAAARAKKGGGGGGSAPAMYDLEALRRKIAVESEEGLQKQILQIQQKYDEEREKIMAGRFKNRADREEALGLIEKDRDRQVADARAAADAAANQKMADGIKYVTDQASQAWGTVQSFMSGNIKQGIESIVSQVGAAFGPAGEAVAGIVNLGIEIGSAIGDAFTDSAAEKFARFSRRLQEAFDFIGISKGGADFITDYFGANDAQVKAETANALAAITGAFKAVGFKNAEDFTKATYDQLARMAPELETALRGDAKTSKQYYKDNEEYFKSLGMSYQDFMRMRKAFHDGSFDMTDLLGQYKDAYDAVNATAETHLQTEQEITAEQERQRQALIEQQLAQDEGLKKLLANREKMKADIQAGAMREGSLDTVQKQAANLQAIIERVGSLGGDTSTYRADLADLYRKGLGDSGFSALSGSGRDVAALMPLLYSGASGGQQYNSTAAYNNSISVNGAPGMQTPGWRSIMEQIQRETGINLLARA